ncbi:MAG: hypothetical protein JNM51_13305 [Bacteroidia bacterium]|nr:hypothetical protein [Bacteroidia bacterium]
MKQLKLFTTIVIMTSMLACEPPVTFTEPQPADTENLLKFPDRLHGQYLSLADSSVLVIGDKIIQRIYDFEQKIHPLQLDSNSKLSGDTVINLITGTREFVKREGDSILVRIHYIDTLFQLDYDNVVRKFKGYYFLNKRYDKESWEVKKLEFSKGKLVVSRISTELEIDKLKEITEAPADTIPPYKFTASKKQFKEFVKNNGFSEGETFVRLK